MYEAPKYLKFGGFSNTQTAVWVRILDFSQRKVATVRGIFGYIRIPDMP